MKKSTLFFLVVGCLLLVVGYSVVFAQTRITDVNPLKTTDITVIVTNIVSEVIKYIGVLALLMFIYGGILWMTSGGSQDKIKKGKQVIIWAIFGLGLVLLSYSIVQFIIERFIAVGGN
ncbi:MAG: hypothetical protein HYW78_02210 [Parcubacteria group bacterium]|nr:hypothetical protein [Parcubacteria group bacterium]